MSSQEERPAMFGLTLNALQSEFRNYLGQLWHSGFNLGPMDGMDFAPPVELREEPDAYRVLVDVPGVPLSQIEVTGTQTGLRISGQKLSPESPLAEDRPQGRVLQSHRQYGSFSRKIDMPAPIDINQVSAQLNNGVLEVIAPKTGQSVPVDVHIEVKAGEEGQGQGQTQG
jgi:HSP20 family protein